MTIFFFVLSFFILNSAANGQVPGVVTSEGKESDILSLIVNQTYYHGTILKAFLSWKLKPGECTRKVPGYLTFRDDTCLCVY